MDRLVALQHGRVIAGDDQQQIEIRAARHELPTDGASIENQPFELVAENALDVLGIRLQELLGLLRQSFNDAFSRCHAASW